jgi:exonuclease SbcC
MRPLKIEMQAFGPFARQQIIDFSLLGQKSFFLIHGPTGAGKTTILDAICFALFGDSSGGERQSNQMRSHHADSSTLTEVRFEFTLGEQHYRVLRIPEQTRPSRRGGGETTQLQKAELHRVDGETAQPIATGWRQVSEKVVGLLGFESAQFRQVTLLPQGQFFEFLKSSSQEREKILQALFGTEVYRRIEERLARQSQELAAEASRVQIQRETLLQQAQVSDESELERRVFDLTTAVTNLQRVELEAQRLDREAEARLTAAIHLADRYLEFDQAEIALKALQEEEAAQVQRRIRFERARAAATLRAYAAAATQAAELVGSETKALDARRSEANNASTEASRAEEQLKLQLDRNVELEQLQRRLNQLDDLKARVEALDSARAELNAAQSQLNQSTEIRSTIDLALNQAIERHNLAIQDVQAHQLKAAQAEGLRAQLNQVQGQLVKVAALTKAETDAQSAEKDLRNRVTALETARAAEVKVRAERDATHRAWVLGQASRLAEVLSSEQPCPVCGSAHHPDLAHLKVQDAGAMVRDLDLEVSEGKLANSESGHRQAQNQHDEAVQTLKGLRARIDELKIELGNDVPSSIDLKAALKSLESQSKAAQAAIVALPNLIAAEALCRDELARVKVQADQATSAVLAATVRQQNCHAVLNERSTGIPPELSEPGQLAAAQNQFAIQIATIKGVINLATAQATEAQRNLTAARVRVQTTEESLSRISNQYAQSVRELDQRLSDAGFDGLSAFSAAQMSDEQLTLEEVGIARFDANLSAGRQRHERASSAVHQHQRPDMTALNLAHREAEAAHLGASNSVRDALSAQEVAEGLLESLRELRTEYQRLQDRYGVMKRVSDLANGVGGQRMSFQRYVLSTLLDQVLAATSMRLRVMSKGRYELRRASAPADRRVAAGLDLEVFDQYTGTVRPVTTLSGGESFLTSLALALGLSDVVQSYAGGIHMDAIFVEEGFGTLDTEALDFAIRALKDLQQSGRLVGIISHVSELREWIDARLEVTTGVAGSSAEFLV